MKAALMKRAVVALVVLSGIACGITIEPPANPPPIPSAQATVPEYAPYQAPASQGVKLAAAASASATT